MLWFNTESPTYLAAVHRLETLKADIIQVKRDLNRALERKARAENNLGLLDETISYLRHSARVVVMREYEKIVFQRAAELQTIIMDNKTIPQLEKNIKVIQSQIDRLTGELPSMKSKVLEFRPRD